MFILATQFKWLSECLVARIVFVTTAIAQDSVAAFAGNWTTRMLVDFESTAMLFVLLLTVVFVSPHRISWYVSSLQTGPASVPLTTERDKLGWRYHFNSSSFSHLHSIFHSPLDVKTHFAVCDEPIKSLMKQVQIYSGSETGVRCCIGTGKLFVFTQHVVALCCVKKSSWPPSWKYAFI